MLYFVVMADTGTGSAKRKRKELTEEQKKAKRDSDRTWAKTRVNCGPSFNRWRELRDLKGFKTDPELAVFLLDRYVICLFYSVHGYYCNTTGI